MIDFSLNKRNEDIEKCLKTLYGTAAGTVALDRDFGIDWSFVDQPQELSRALITAEIIEKTQKYEPRVNVSEVLWQSYENGSRLIPKVVVELVED